MKSVMISIQPKWCELIASGQKTIEVRKTHPKTEVPFKCYIYETKDAKLIGVHKVPYLYSEGYGRSFVKKNSGNGKVIGEFICDMILEIDCDSVAPFDYGSKDYIEDKICFGRDELIKYAGFTRPYGWHISDLVIYDKPKELSEFKKIHRDCWYADLGLAKRDCLECRNENCMLSRPPQSWCYVDEVMTK